MEALPVDSRANSELRATPANPRPQSRRNQRRINRLACFAWWVSWICIRVIPRMVSCNWSARRPVLETPWFPILSWILASFLASVEGRTGGNGYGSIGLSDKPLREDQNWRLLNACDAGSTPVSPESMLRAGENSCQFTSMADVLPVGFGKE